MSSIHSWCPPNTSRVRQTHLVSSKHISCRPNTSRVVQTLFSDCLRLYLHNQVRQETQHVHSLDADPERMHKQ